MGIKSDIPKVPSIALGTADLSLYEMISAYSTFPDNGISVEPVGLLKIEDSNGNLLYQYNPDGNSSEVLDHDVARTMVEMMKDVVDNGTGRTLRTVYGVKAELGGKTGTTQDNTDGWFIGYTPTLVAGAWVGNDNPVIHFRTIGLGAGAHTALPIFGMFMHRLENDSRFFQYTRTSFVPLSGFLAEKLDCEDYSLDDPNQNFFERLFGSKSSVRKDSLREVKHEEHQQTKKGLDRPGLLEKMKELFRKK